MFGDNIFEDNLKIISPDFSPSSFLASKHFCVQASRPHRVLASQLHSFLAFQQATGKMIKYKCYVKLLFQIA